MNEVFDEEQVNNLIDTFIEIQFEDSGGFLKIKETLTRIGITQKSENILWQSCHILHKKGKFYIVHFKELFALDGKSTNFNETDLARRNTIACLLENWGLLKILNPTVCESPRAPRDLIVVIPFRDKTKWNLEAKYTIGKKIND